MVGSIAAPRLAALAAGFDRSPAYAGLADELMLLIGDGRIGLDLRLPSERDLSVALAVSRTTVTRAYAGLVESGFAEARQGSGTYTRLPGGRRRGLDRTLTPSTTGDDVIDLNCAAPSALPGIGTAYAEAVQDLPRYLGGHGYFPTGRAGPPGGRRRVVRRARAADRPEPDHGGARFALGADGRRAGPGRPGRPGARRDARLPQRPRGAAAGRRPAGRAPDGRRRLGPRRGRPAAARDPAAAGLPDPRLPEPHRQPDVRRRAGAAARRCCGASGTTPVVDESHQPLALDGRPMPRPFATFAPETVTLGSTSKSFWGGLRIGWVRCPDGVLERLMDARVALDLGSPVLEQLVAARLLARREELWADQRTRLREQRDALADALRTELPDWRFRLPRGGLSLWCELPATGAGAARPRSRWRPSAAASWSRPGRSSPSTVGSTRSSGCRSPGRPTSCATAVARLARGVGGRQRTALDGHCPRRPDAHRASWSPERRRGLRPGRRPAARSRRSRPRSRPAPPRGSRSRPTARPGRGRPWRRARPACRRC